MNHSRVSCAIAHTFRRTMTIRTRRSLALRLLAPLALVAACAPLLTSSTEAAPASSTIAYTGTLVATPPTTLPAPLLLQVGGSTVRVVVTASTAVVDKVGNPLSLDAVQDGDTIFASGTPLRRGGIRVSLVEDLSQEAAPLQEEGTLGGQFSGGICLQNAAVVGVLALASDSPCPSGEQPVYLTANTSFEDANGAAFDLVSMQNGDTLDVTVASSNSQTIATVVQDTSEVGLN